MTDIQPLAYKYQHILSSNEVIQGDTRKQELLKNPTKIEEIQEKKFNDRN